MKKNNVELFFTCDDGYIPLFSVVLESIRKYADPNRFYIIRVLYTDSTSPEYRERIINEYFKDNIKIEFVDVSIAIKKICDKLHTRDYYSKYTYFRLFIPKLYPELDKALYLDSDIVLMDDVAKLYDIELGDNYVGAVTDEAVAAVPEFRHYVTTRIGLENSDKYFNAGVLLMNLNKLREIHFEDLFIDMITRITFNVAQDQDYLNTICKDNVLYLDKGWNKMPVDYSMKLEDIKLIHYNLSFKPWKMDGINYAKQFWDYAEECPFIEHIKKIKEEFTPIKQEITQQQSVNLIAMAEAQANDVELNNEITDIVKELKEKYIK